MIQFNISVDIFAIVKTIVFISTKSCAEFKESIGRIQCVKT